MAIVDRSEILSYQPDYFDYPPEAVRPVMTPEEVQARVDAILAEADARIVRERDAAVSHVRRPLGRNRSGNQFYKNPGLKGPGPAVTICGGEPSAYDLDQRTAASLERKGELDQHLKCPDCRARVRSAPR